MHKKDCSKKPAEKMYKIRLHQKDCRNKLKKYRIKKPSRIHGMALITIGIDRISAAYS